jgi:hypothetical protein
MSASTLSVMFMELRWFTIALASPSLSPHTTNAAVLADQSARETAELVSSKSLVAISSCAKPTKR